MRDEKDVRNTCGTEAPKEVPMRLMGEAAAGRQSAESLLRDYVHRLRREADGLDELLNQLPRKLSHAADEALWEILIKIRR